MDDAIEAKGRAGMYRFLASVYLAAPTQEVVDAVRAAGSSPFGFASAETAELLNVACRDGASLEGLKEEFNALFVVPLGRYTAPFEAAFCDEREVAGKTMRGLLMGPSTTAVKRCYAMAGARIAVKELPDHIGCELAFMEFLCNEEALTAERGAAALIRAREREFLAEHPARWARSLAKRIGEKASLSWYRAQGRLTADYIEHDLRSLGGAN